MGTYQSLGYSLSPWSPPPPPIKVDVVSFQHLSNESFVEVKSDLLVINDVHCEGSSGIDGEVLQ